MTNKKKNFYSTNDLFDLAWIFLFCWYISVGGFQPTIETHKTKCQHNDSHSIRVQYRWSFLLHTYILHTYIYFNLRLYYTSWINFYRESCICFARVYRVEFSLYIKKQYDFLLWIATPMEENIKVEPIMMFIKGKVLNFNSSSVFWRLYKRLAASLILVQSKIH